MSVAEFVIWCKNNSKRVVCNALKEQPELVERSDTGGYTPLHHAARRGLAKLTRVLLDHGAQVNAQASSNATPLHYASAKGSAKVARVLLEHGAEVNVRDRHGCTPLHDAARFVYPTMIRLLLKHGAEELVNAQDSCGETPLHLAASCFHRRESVRVLLEYGADRSIENDTGETARDIAMHHIDIKALLDTYVPVRAPMTQVLLGLRGPTESALTRFAKHSMFEPKVLSLVKCLVTGEKNAAFEHLQREAAEHDSSSSSCSSTNASASSRVSKKARRS